MSPQDSCNTVVPRSSIFPLSQVIHLVRDPRARYHSLLVSPGQVFKDQVRDFAGTCRDQLEDLDISKLVPEKK